MSWYECSVISVDLVLAFWPCNRIQISCDFIAFHPTPPTTLPAGISISTQPCNLGLCQYEFCQTQLCAERQIQFASHNPPNQPPDPASKGWTTNHANHEQKTFENMQGESVVSSCFEVISYCGGSCLVDLKLALAQTNLPLSRRTAGTHWALAVTFQVMNISRYPNKKNPKVSRNILDPGITARSCVLCCASAQVWHGIKAMPLQLLNIDLFHPRYVHVYKCIIIIMFYMCGNCYQCHHYLHHCHHQHKGKVSRI